MSNVHEAAIALRQKYCELHSRYHDYCEVLAQAYLAEHLPDDDEPITPANITDLVPADCEWVKRPTGTVAAFWEVGSQLFSLTAYFGGEVSFTVRTPHGPRVDWSCKMTRGQLRKLLAVL